MSIAETIYQHVKALPPAKALEVLQFAEFLESKSDSKPKSGGIEAMANFLQSLPVGQRGDAEINAKFQTMRDEWNTQAKTTQESIAKAIEKYICFISKTANDVGFNLSNIKQIRVNDSNNLREQLKQQIAIYYGLVSSGD